MQYNNQPRLGFTIVELLIVLVVIGVLSSITVVAFNAIAQRATASKFLSAIDSYEKAIRMHYAEFGSVPEHLGPSGEHLQVCLGRNYPEAEGFQSGYCYSDLPSGSAPGLGQASNSVNTAIEKYITPLPDVNGYAFDFLGTPFFRGIGYQGVNRISSAIDTTAVIYYYINGNQECGRGQKSTQTLEGETFTVCQVIFTPER